jgi:Na+-translocating ferredoxin:NAD+ oxidoreductase RnfG subunit
VVVLAAICLVVTLLLSAVNFVTAPIIEQASAAAAQASLLEVLPEATGFSELELPEDAPETVTAVYADNGGSGYAVTLSTSSQYSESPMQLTVGIGTDGLIKNIVLTNYAETKDFGADYPSTYVGQDSALSGVELVSGVTYSSTAFRNAVNDAYSVLFEVADVQAGEKSDDQLAAEALAELIPSSVNNAGACEVTLDEESGVYVTANRTGYAIVDESGVYVADAFGNYVGFVGSSEENSAVSDKLCEIAAEKYAEASEKAIKRIVKIYEDAEVTTLSPEGLNSTVNGAYSFTSEGARYYAFTASPFGYGGAMTLIYIVDENGAIAKFKVMSHNETEYYGAKFSESGYTSAFEGENVADVSDDVTLLSGCTFTTTAVRTALADISAAFEAVKEVG